MAIVQYSQSRKVVILIGDETVTGVKQLPDDTHDLLSDISKTSRIWDFSKDKFVLLEEDTVFGEDSLIPHLVTQIDEYGVFILPVTCRELLGKPISLLNFKDIFEYLTLDKDGLSPIKKVCRYLKSYKEDKGIEEYPEFISIIYTGSIRDSLLSNQDEINLKYYSEIQTLTLNLKNYIKNLNGVNITLNDETSKTFTCVLKGNCHFFDISVNLNSLSPAVDDGNGNNEFPIDLSGFINLKLAQERLSTQNNFLYKLIPNTSNSTTGEFEVDSNGVIKTSSHIKSSTEDLLGSENIKINGYRDLNGAIVYRYNVPGYLYSREEKSYLSQKIVSSLETHFLWGNNNSMLDVSIYKWIDTFDHVYLFKAKRSLSIDDFKDIQPEINGELNTDTSIGGEFVKKINGKSGNLFYYVPDKDEDKDLEFTHILIYANGTVTVSNPNPELIFVGMTKMPSKQIINSQTKIKVKLNRNISGKGYSVYTSIQSGDSFITLRYDDHYDKDTYETREIKTSLDKNLSNRLGIVKSSKVNDVINLSLNLTTKNRSHRLTNEISRSGDSLFIDAENGIRRDRDNSYYSPYFSFHKPDSFTEELSKYAKIGFDSKLGLYYWYIIFNSDSDCEIHIVFTSNRRNKEIIYEIKGFKNIIETLKNCYESPVNKVVIALARSDLILNFNGKVYKIQKEGNFISENEGSIMRLSSDNSIFGELYRGKGYIIFPSFYDLWHLAYIIVNKQVMVIDCSGGIHDIMDDSFAEEIPNYAYVENYPGPKNTDYKNIVASYLLGGLVVYEQILNGVSPDKISVYDSSVVVDNNDFKLELYSLSYKNKHKISLKKKDLQEDKSWSNIQDFFIGNEGYGFKKGNKWYYSYFNVDSDSEIQNYQGSGRIVNARGVRILLDPTNYISLI